MKLIFFLTLCISAFALHSKKALEIHIFNVGNADSQLIVFPSGYNILIDCGDYDTKNAKNTKHIAKRIEKVLGHKTIDIFVLTHYHPDHAGEIGKNGIWYLVEKAGFTIKKFLKRNAGSYNGNKLKDCNRDTIKWKYVGDMSKAMAKVVCYTVSSKEKTKLSKVAENAHRCNDQQIVPPDAGAKVRVLMRDALGVKSTASGNPVARNSFKSGSKISENDLSICMRIQYQKFVYATCGDLSGYFMDGGDKNFHDIESSIAPMMGEVDLYNANHHGSSTSSNEKWCKTLKPTATVISCGESTGEPKKTPMKRLKAVGSKIYTTGTDCNKSNINAVGGITEVGEDIVITVPTNGTKFTLSSLSGKKSKTFNIKQNKKAPTKCKLLDA